MARKIVFYTHAFSGGGAETVFARLARAFAAAGDDVIFAADEAGPDPVADAPGLRHVLLKGRHDASLRGLAALLRAERPDASFSALGAQNLKHVLAAVGAGRRRGCVLGYHGFAAAEPKRLSRISFALTPVLTRIAARTICVSDALLADLRTRWRASHRRTVRIYNPVVAVADGAAPARAPGPALVLACGRFVPGKRFLDLVRAFARLADVEARLAILGDGPERPAIEAEIAALGLQARVALPGHVAPTPYYRAAHCLVIASETESFGLTAAEAMSHGVPVVTTDCGGPAEILDHGRYGHIVPVGDIGALAAAIDATLADPVDQASLRSRAGIFDIAIVHRTYAELIDALAADGGGLPAKLT